MNKKITKLIAAIGGCLIIGGIGSIFTTPNINTWYATLNKPSFNPPNWIFAPVWTSLFILMGLALFIVINKKRSKKTAPAVLIFIIQLILNIFWSVLFFTAHQTLLAFIEVIILWLAILTSLIAFYKINKTAGYLLIPYLLWVSFAAVLNYALYFLNK